MIESNEFTAAPAQPTCAPAEGSGVPQPQARAGVRGDHRSAPTVEELEQFRAEVLKHLGTKEQERAPVGLLGLLSDSGSIGESEPADATSTRAANVIDFETARRAHLEE